MAKRVTLNEREMLEWKYMGAFIQVLLLAFVLSLLGFDFIVGLLAAIAIILILKIGFVNNVLYDASSAPDKFK